MKKSTSKQKELQNEQLLKDVAKSMSRKYAAYLLLKEKRESGDTHAID